MKTLRLLPIIIVFVSCSKEDNCRCETIAPEGQGTYYIEFCNDATFQDVSNNYRSDKWLAQYERENPCK